MFSQNTGLNVIISCLEGILTLDTSVRGHEEVEWTCGAETRGLGKGVTSGKLHAGVSGETKKTAQTNKKTEIMKLPLTTKEFLQLLGE